MKKRFIFSLLAIFFAGLGLGGVSLAEGEVAQIGETQYATLQAAISAASGGDTITLLNDVTVTSASYIDVTKEITIDLDGHYIHYETIGWNSIRVLNGGNLTINDNSGNGGIDGSYAAILIYGDGTETNIPQLTINGGTLKGKYYAVSGNGSKHNTIIEINGGTLIGGVNESDFVADEPLGIYHPQAGNITINGGTVQGYTSALEIRAGNLVINGGEFVAISPEDPTIAAANGNGSTTNGAAIAVAQHNTKKPISVIINSGTFNGVSAFFQSNPQNNDYSSSTKVESIIAGGFFEGKVGNQVLDEENYKLSIEGGKFSEKPDTSLIVEGKIAKQDGDSFVVGDKELPELQTNIGEQRFVAGSNEWVEFTFTTVPNDYENVMVIGGSDFGVLYEDKIAALEYKAGEDTWYDMKGQSFGGNGFPLTDATSTFRVKFTEEAAGSYTFNAFIRSTADSTDLATLNVPFTVYEKTKPELTTTITDGKVGVAQSFSFTTVANDYAGTNVVALSQFNDNAALESLYYVYGGQKIDILNGNGQFGADAGFPLTNASSDFEVTFKTAGTYTFTVDLVDAADHNIKYATVEKTINITNKSSGGSSSSSSSSSSSNKTGDNNTGATAETGTTADTGADAPAAVDPQAVQENGYTNEMNEAYEFAYANGITTMKTIDDAEMFDGLTRIAMAKMLSQYAINVLGKSPADVEVPNFTDVSADLDAEYANGVTLAYKLGIMGINMPDNKFLPYETVTRAQFGTALSRLLFGIEDGEDAYYTTHLAKLKEAGIITNDDPTLEELRGYVMLMLMRSAK